MSYSRWMDSQWYTYPANGYIECIYLDGRRFPWYPTVPYVDFMENVQHNVSLKAFHELQNVFDRNGVLEDIYGWFDKWNAEANMAKVNAAKAKLET